MPRARRVVSGGTEAPPPREAVAALAVFRFIVRYALRAVLPFVPRSVVLRWRRALWRYQTRR